MRIYIIGNDGISPVPRASGTVNKGEVAVASREICNAARLHLQKRRACAVERLPVVEKPTRSVPRYARAIMLVSIEALPDPGGPPADTKLPSKQDAVIAISCNDPSARPSTKSRCVMVAAHTVRGRFSRTLKKTLRLTLASATESAAGSIASPPRSRHESRDPRLQRLSGGALAPPQLGLMRRLRPAVARSLQSPEASAYLSANCCCERVAYRMQEIASRGLRPSGSVTPSNLLISQREAKRWRYRPSSRAGSLTRLVRRMAGSNL